MSNPSGPEQGGESGGEPADPTTGDPEEHTPAAEPADGPPTDEPSGESADDHEPATEVFAPSQDTGEPGDESAAAAETEVFSQPGHDHEPATEVIASAPPQPGSPGEQPAEERRFTAPSGFDAGSTEKIDRPPEPATEVFARPDGPAEPGSTTQPKVAAPQVIPPRGEAPPPPKPARRSWGWVIALVLVIGALVAVAVLGTLLLTRGSDGQASQEDQVRSTIENFDRAVQKGDLATLRGITCGATRDSYVKYDDRSWADTHARVAAAKQYPVVASIDQVVVNGDHAEANVTTFMAFAPQTRSTRSFDLQYRDDQWKICQAPN